MGGRVAAYLVSNRGPQFASQLLNATCRQWGEIQKLTTAYHLQTNLTERVNKTLKIMIASCIKDSNQNWYLWIHEFRFTINSPWQESSNYTPAEIALGRKLKGPLKLFQYRSLDPDQSTYEVERQQFLPERVKENVVKAQSRQQRYYNWKRRQEIFQERHLVCVRAHLMSCAGVIAIYSQASC